MYFVLYVGRQFFIVVCISSIIHLFRYFVRSFVLSLCIILFISLVSSLLRYVFVLCLVSYVSLSPVRSFFIYLFISIYSSLVRHCSLDGSFFYESIHYLCIYLFPCVFLVFVMYCFVRSLFVSLFLYLVI